MRWIDSLSLIGFWTAGSATLLTLIYILFTIWLLFFDLSLSHARILPVSSQCIFCRDFWSDLMALERFKLVIYRAMCALFMCVWPHCHAIVGWSRHANCKLNEIICATNLTLVCAFDRIKWIFRHMSSHHRIKFIWTIIVIANNEMYGGNKATTTVEHTFTRAQAPHFLRQNLQHYFKKMITKLVCFQINFVDFISEGYRIVNSINLSLSCTFS